MIIKFDNDIIDTPEGLQCLKKYTWDDPNFWVFRASDPLLTYRISPDKRQCDITRKMQLPLRVYKQNTIMSAVIYRNNIALIFLIHPTYLGGNGGIPKTIPSEKDIDPLFPNEIHFLENNVFNEKIQRDLILTEEYKEVRQFTLTLKFQ